jgi:hypothetical protein
MAPLPTAPGTAGAGCSWLATNKDGTGSYFCHAGAYQYPTDTTGTPDADGAYMSTLVQSPWVNTSGTHPDQHSLAELAVEAKGANGTMNIIEIGWRVDPSDPTFAGDQTPRLFVFHWIDGVPQCYDNENGGCGFTPYGSSGITPGMALASGTTQQFEIDYSGGDWWYGLNGTWFGYLRGTLWNNTFTKAELVQMFGEVASTKSIPCSNMGNGYLGSSPGSVAVTNVGFFNSTDTVNLAPYNPDDPTLYDSQVTTSYNSFRYGGSGGRTTSAACTTP